MGEQNLHGGVEMIAGGFPLGGGSNILNTNQ